MKVDYIQQISSSDIMIQSPKVFCISSLFRAKDRSVLSFLSSPSAFFSLSDTSTDRHSTESGVKGKSVEDDISLHDYSVWRNHGYMLQIFLLYLVCTYLISYLGSGWGGERKKTHAVHKAFKTPQLLWRTCYEAGSKYKMSLRARRGQANPKNKFTRVSFHCHAQLKLTQWTRGTLFAVLFGNMLQH